MQFEYMYVHFIRHGQSEANQSRTIIQGQFDSPLSEMGRQQASELGAKLSFSFERVYASPLKRVKQTAIIALSTIGWDLNDIIYFDELMEIGMGNFEGLTFEEVGLTREELRPIIMFEHDVLIDKHEGESINNFKKRTVEAFDKVLQDAKKHNVNSILVFSHGGVMRSILKHHLHIYEGTYYNAQIISIHQVNGKWNLIENN
ncbi:MAG: histidine phosphatase family protein [Candidatus Kariarchaeaceae archaeon]